MSLKASVKRIEGRLRVENDQEVVIYDIPNEDGSVDVLHVSSRGSRVETIDQREYERRTSTLNRQENAPSY